jgi:peptide/nickel transport system permease protein
MMLLIIGGSSFLSYNLMAYSSNPLSVFGESTEKNKAFLIKQMIRQLQLDVPPPGRFFLWLRGAVAGLWGQLDLGKTRNGYPVLDVIGRAIPITFRLVIASTILAIVIGITIGMITAIRQYTRFDYSMTFISFLLFSIPIFWVAVLLKLYLAISFNDFLVNPVVPPEAVVGFGVVIGFILSGIIGGTRKVYLSILIGTSILFSGLLEIANLTNWFLQPGLGIVGVGVLAFGIAVMVVQLSTGLSNKRSLIAGLATAGVVTLGYYPFQMILNRDAGILSVVLVFSITVFAACVIGNFVEKIDKKVNIRTAVLTAFLATFPIFFDRFMQVFPEYYNSDGVHGRVVPTLGQSTDILTDEQRSNFWFSGLDIIMHLILPTLALTLISFAGYVRYSRASLLEVLNMDYIRTARAKGLNERTVIMRHALRNAMLPLTTILVNDFAGVIGGAIITEKVFGWKGMGSVFNEALGRYDLNLFMGVFILGSVLTVMANLVADLLFGVVDPRIRIRK